MSKTYTITSEQISSIHNGMCSMYRLRDLAQDMFKKDSTINQLIEDAFKNIEPVKKDLMGKKDADFDRIFKLAEELAKEHNLRETRWSIYDIDSFLDETDIPVGSWITAPNDSDHAVQVEGSLEKATWMDLWKAVDKLATLNGEHGFGNHVFIEKFQKDFSKDNTYEVWLGS